MEWFFNIFDDNSDKARLIAIVLSSVVALGLLLLNQFFQNRREKTKLFIEKVEELYKAVLNLEHLSLDFMNETHERPISYKTNGADLKEIEVEVKEKVYQISMLIGLYFSDIPEFEDGDWGSDLLKLREKMSSLAKQDNVTSMQYKPIYRELEVLIESLKLGCKKANKKYKY